LHRVLSTDERAERVALMLSDVLVARSLGWSSPLPLAALHLKSADLRAVRAGEAGLAVPVALLRAVQTAIGVAHDLARKGAALEAAATRIRAKGASDAVALFLAEDAVAPSLMLSPVIKGTRTPMSPRAARRFCDRLIELGVAVELTGRDTFRLYGLAP
ncbi:MAG: DUF1403 family protein, partial [Pseudomonadota bacterium]